MFIDKDFDKQPRWYKNATELDNIAYQLYLDNDLHTGVTIYEQELIIYFHKLDCLSSDIYSRASKILRLKKLKSLNDRQ